MAGAPQLTKPDATHSALMWPVATLAKPTACAVKTPRNAHSLQKLRTIKNSYREEAAVGEREDVYKNADPHKTVTLRLQKMTNVK